MAVQSRHSSFGAETPGGEIGANVAGVLDPLGLFTKKRRQIDPTQIQQATVDTAGVQAGADLARSTGAGLQAPQGTAATVGDPAQIDRAGQQEWADLQRALLGQYQGLATQYGDIASGRAPSAAEIMLKQAQDRAVGQMMGASAATAGTNFGSRREALGAMGDYNLQAGQQMAAVRAQEQAAALQGLGQTLGGIGTLGAQGRGFELDIAGRNAQFLQDSIMKNADFQQQMAVLNPQLQAQTMELAQRYMAMGLEADVAIMNALAETSRANATNATNVDIANVSAPSEGTGIIGGLLG